MRRFRFLVVAIVLGLMSTVARAQPACVELSPSDPAADAEVTMTAFDAAGEQIDLSDYDILEIGFGEAGFRVNVDGSIDLSSGVGVFTMTQAMIDSPTFNAFFILPGESGDAFIGLADANKPFPFENTAEAFAAGGDCALPKAPVCVELSPMKTQGGEQVTLSAEDVNGDPVDLSGFEIVEIGFGEAGFRVNVDGSVDLSSGNAVFSITQEMLDSPTFNVFFVLPFGLGEAFVGLADANKPFPFDTTNDAFLAGGTCVLPDPPVCLQVSPENPAAGDECTIIPLDANGNAIDISFLGVIELGFAPGAANAVFPDTSSGVGVFTMTQEILDSTYFDFFTGYPAPDGTGFFVADPGQTVADVFAAGGNCREGVPTCVELPTKVSAGADVTMTALNRFGDRVDLTNFDILEIGFGEAGFLVNVKGNVDLSSGDAVFAMTQEMLDSPTFNLFFVLPGDSGTAFIGLADANKPFPFDTTADAFAAGGDCSLAPPMAPLPACYELIPTNPQAGDEVTIVAFDRDGNEIDMSGFILLETGWAPAGGNARFPNLSSGRGVVTVDQEMLDSDYLDFFAVLPAGQGEGSVNMARFGARTPFDTVAEAFAAGGNCASALVPAGAPACLELIPATPRDGERVTLSAQDRDGFPVDMSTLNAVEIGFGEGGSVLQGDGNLQTASGNAVFTISQSMIDSNRMDFFAIVPEVGGRQVVLAHPDQKSTFESAADAFLAGGDCGDNIPSRGHPVCLNLEPADPVDGDLVTVSGVDFFGGEVDMSTLRSTEIFFGDEVGGVFVDDGSLDVSSGNGEFLISQAMLDSEIFGFFSQSRQQESDFPLTGEETGFGTTAEAFAAGGSCESTRVGPFLRLDCDGDGRPCTGVNDAIILLNWLFLGDARPPCVAGCDSDGNGDTSLNDAIFGLNVCFAGMGQPPAPYPECGLGSGTDVELGCETPPLGCQ